MKVPFWINRANDRFLKQLSLSLLALFCKRIDIAMETSVLFHIGNGESPLAWSWEMTERPDVAQDNFFAAIVQVFLSTG
jgi:hypothetical protein